MTTAARSRRAPMSCIPTLKSDRSRRLPEHGLAEAVSLAAALPGLDVVGAEVVRLPRVHPGMLFGSGKVDELKARARGGRGRSGAGRRPGLARCSSAIWKRNGASSCWTAPA